MAGEPFTILGMFRYLCLPALTLGLGSIASIARYMRSALLNVIQEDYLRTARAKGLSEGIVIYKHALRNALLPILTLVGFMIPSIFSGAVIIEDIFAWPGLGSPGDPSYPRAELPGNDGDQLDVCCFDLLGEHHRGRILRTSRSTDPL